MGNGVEGSSRSKKEWSMQKRLCRAQQSWMYEISRPLPETNSSSLFGSVGLPFFFPRKCTNTWENIQSTTRLKISIQWICIEGKEEKSLEVTVSVRKVPALADGLKVSWRAEGRSLWEVFCLPGVRGLSWGLRPQVVGTSSACLALLSGFIWYL